VNASGTNLWTKTSANSSHAYRYTKCYVRAPIATASASSTQVTSGTAVTLGSLATSVTETNPTYSYAWTSTSGFTSAIQNPSVTPTTNTTYTVIITNTAIGCSDTATVTVNVNGSSTLAATTSANPSAFCPGTLVQLNCIPSGGTTYNYQWSSNPVGFTSTIQNPTVTPTANTSYTVTVTSGSSSTTSTSSVTLYSIPATPTITQVGNTLTSSASTGNQWYYNSSIIQGSTATTCDVTQSGTYQVLVTDANGCTAMSAAYTTTVGILERQATIESITIYPNPTQNIIYLSVPTSMVSFETQLMDIYGKFVFRNMNQSTIDLSNLSNGIYFLEISVKGKSVQRNKIVLNK
jgi:hypothetical protein